MSLLWKGSRNNCSRRVMEHGRLFHELIPNGIYILIVIFLVLSETIEYTLSFKGTIYSLNKGQQYSPERPIKFNDDKSAIWIDSLGDGKVHGTIKYSTRGDDEKQMKLIWSRFLSALIVKGFVFETSEEPSLSWFTPNSEVTRASISVSLQIELLPENQNLQNNDMLDIYTLFKDMRSNKTLIAMASYMKNDEKLSKNIGGFIWYWIEFNRMYKCLNQKTERENIINYICRLTNKATDLLTVRNKQLFKALSNSQLELYTKQGKITSVSTELQNAIHSQNNQDVVKWAALCVYALRNELFHENKRRFTDFVGLGCFLRDLIYAPLITTYKETKKIDIGLCPTKFNP